MKVAPVTILRKATKGPDHAQVITVAIKNADPEIESAWIRLAPQKILVAMPYKRWIISRRIKIGGTWRVSHRRIGLLELG